MLLEKEPLYEYIKKNIVDGELPRNFSLSSNVPKNQIRFADGAMDGIAIYHMGHTEVSKESMELLKELMQDISDKKYDSGREKLEKFVEKNTPINAIDDFERFIFENTSWINPNYLYKFAMECIMSSNVDLVKYGLEMTEVFSEPDENLKEMIRILALCDEFTIFCIFHMQNWSDSNDEIFAIAQKVHGWGRIHAVKYLKPDNEEIKKWFLKEGIVNNVVSDYSALEVYKKAEIRKLLKTKLAEEEIYLIANIIDALIAEGPITGISAIEDADSMLLDFLDQVKRCQPKLELCETVFGIEIAERSEEVHSVCKEILYTDKVKQAVRHWVSKGKAIKLAQNLGISFLEPLYQCMIENFDKNYYQCNYLLKSDEYREKVLELFRRELPMDQMAREPEDNPGLGKEYENDTKLCYLIQDLGDFPLCGADFILLALRSPVIRNRNMALKILSLWCQMKTCTLKELSIELFQEVEGLKGKECSESVIRNINEYGF